MLAKLRLLMLCVLIFLVGTPASNSAGFGPVTSPDHIGPADNPDHAGPVAFTSGAEHLLFYWRCEASTLDGTHDYSAGDTTATQNSGAAINTDGAYIGTNGLDFPGSSDYYRFDISSGDIFDPQTWTVGIWLKVETFVNLSWIWYAYEATNDYVGCRHSVTGGMNEIQCGSWNTAGNATVTTSLNLSTSTWVFLVYSGTTAGSHSIDIYNTSLGLIGSITETETVNEAIPTALYFGPVGAYASDQQIDNIMSFGAVEADVNITNFANHDSYTDF